MFEVALWIAENTQFDRLYVYERNRPIHVSIGPESLKQITHMKKTSSNKRMPKTFKTTENFLDYTKNN